MVSISATAGVRQRTPHPSRLAGAAALAAVVAVGIDALLALIGRSVFSVPASFTQFDPISYISLTVIGVIGASIGWAIIAAKAKDPGKLLFRLAVIVVPVTWLADAALLVAGESPIGVVILMIMHIGVGTITYFALSRIAPPRSSVAVTD